MKIKVLILFLSIIFLASCSSGEKKETNENVASEDIEVKPSAQEEKEKVKTENKEESKVANTVEETPQNVKPETTGENITVQAAISSKNSNDSYKITNVYNAAADKTLEDMTLNLSGYQGDKNFEEGDVIEIQGLSSQGVLSANTVNIISKASGYNEEELEKINEDPAPKAGDKVVINGTVLQTSSSEILLESIGGDLSEDMAKVFTSTDFTVEVQPGSTVRVSGTIQGFENESVLINATGVFPQ